MSPTPCAPSRRLRPAIVRTFFLGASLLVLAAFGSMACEDRAIGRPCDVLADASTIQAVYNPSALECPSRICLKPDVQPGGTAVGDPTHVPPLLPTAPYCSATCSKDSDCDGQKRNQSNGSDARCMNGYTCGAVFSVGPFCCKKLCLCKDFYNLNQSGGLETLPICNKTPNGCLPE
jgi:hypothetical protein